MARANWRDLARAAEGRGEHDHAVFATLFIDRLGLAVPRLAALPANDALQASDCLAELRAGLNILDLRRARRILPKSVVQEIDAVLASLARLFRARAARRRVDAAHVLAEIDLAIAAAAGCMSKEGRRQVLLGLVGIRRVLFPQSAPYAPPAIPVLQSVSVPLMVGAAA